MKEKRIIIFAGGNLNVWALAEINDDDVLVGADSGALFLIRQQRRPHLAVGDFDSVTPEQLDVIRQGSDEVLTVDAVMKDWTDTELAFNWALEQRPAEIVIIGALGTRFDHSLANVHLLRKGLQHGIACKIVDEHNEIYVIDRYARLDQRHFPYCSLLPLSMEVTGITLRGFQYPLQEATLTIGHSLGISNVITAQYGEIFVESGLLLVILSKDE